MVFWIWSQACNVNSNVQWCLFRLWERRQNPTNMKTYTAKIFWDAHHMVDNNNGVRKTRQQTPISVSDHTYYAHMLAYTFGYKHNAFIFYAHITVNRGLNICLCLIWTKSSLSLFDKWPWRHIHLVPFRFNYIGKTKNFK